MTDEKMKFDFSKAEEPKSNYTEKLRPGAYEGMTVMGVEFGESANENKTPYAEVTVSCNGAQHTDKFYLTPKSMSRLKELMIDCGNTPASLEASLSAAQIKNMIMGKSFNAILGGREFMSKEDGKIYIASEFPFTKYTAPVGDRSLVFNDKKHIRKYKENPNTASNNTSSFETVAAPMEAPAGDLPF